MRFFISVFLILFTLIPASMAVETFSEAPDIFSDPVGYSEWKAALVASSETARPRLERPAEPMDWFVQNGYVGAYIDETTGEFEEGGDRFGTGAYRKLTYSFPSAPGTGWIIYYVDGNSGKTDGTMPNTSSNYLSDNVAYSIWNNWNGVYIRQEITTVSLGGAPGENEQVKFKTIMKPADGACHDVGCLVFYDTMLDTDDAARIATAHGYTGIAEIFFGFSVPAIWRAYQGGYPPAPGALTALGILIGFEAVEPDVFWYGAWGSAFGNGWDDSEWIALTGGTFGDSATMVKWYPRHVCEGDSAVFVTYYGIGEITPGLDLTINAGVPAFSTGCTGITPNPFTLSAMITNPGATSVDDVEVTLTLPPTLSLAGGLNPVNLGSLSGYGGSRLVTWTIDIDPSAYGTSACYDIEVTWDSGGPVSRTYCPFIPEPNSFSVNIDAEFTSICAGGCSQLRADLDTTGAPDRIWSYLWRPSVFLSDTTSFRTEACPESTTTYWVIVSDGLDCIDSTSVTIVVNEDPIVELKDTTICRGHTTTISPTVTPDVPGNIYLWFPMGDTTRSLTVSPTTTTTYTVVVISPEGCFSDDEGTIFVIDCAPPWSRLIDPFDGAWTACNDQDIRLVIDDEGEVDTMSIRFSVQGVTYSLADAELSMLDDSTLVFTPSTPWADGDTVRWSLDSLSNGLGIAASVLSGGVFYVDLSSPQVIRFEPPTGTIMETPYPTLNFAIVDGLSGIDSSLVSISINESPFPIGVPGFDYIFAGDTLNCAIDCAQLGVAFLHSDSVIVSVMSGDSPDYCPPNEAVFSWWFMIDLSVGCNRYPNPVTPNGDGINDVAIFDYPNMFSGPAELSIFDVRNTLVYSANIGPATDFSEVGNRYWDCRDGSGKLVKDGLYIYVLIRDGQIICNGTLIVGR